MDVYALGNLSNNHVEKNFVRACSLYYECRCAICIALSQPNMSSMSATTPSLECHLQSCRSGHVLQSPCVGQRCSGSFSSCVHNQQVTLITARASLICTCAATTNSTQRREQRKLHRCKSGPARRSGYTTVRWMQSEFKASCGLNARDGQSSIASLLR